MRAQQILPGTNDKVAIIGRSMGGASKTPPLRSDLGVVDYAGELRKMGYKTELYAGPNLPDSAKREIQELQKIHGEVLPDEVLVKTEAYKLNREWAERVKREGYTVIDLGDPNKKGPSVFYDAEKEIIFRK